MSWFGGGKKRKPEEKSPDSIFNKVEEEADSIRGTAAVLRQRIEARRAELGIPLQERP